MIHKLFHYRGVIIDVDPSFQGTLQWYEKMALSRPPKDRPWYRVLVHNAGHETYVAQRNVAEDTSAEPVHHPLINDYFDDFKDGRYLIDKHKHQ